MFEDVTAQTSIAFRHQAGRTPEKYLIEAMGAGVAMLDYNGDGLLDVYFVNGARLRDPMGDPMGEGAVPDKTDPKFWNRLYENRGGWCFRDVTEQAGVAGRGYGMGAAVGDYDNDGDPDLYVTNFGGSTLYQNNGFGDFRDVTEEAGVRTGGWSGGAAFVDYDHDGLLDLFVARYLDWDFDKNIPCGPHLPKQRSYCHPRRFPPVQHRLFHNTSDGRFEDVSSKAGIAAHPGKGLGVALIDFDRDGWTDIFVANNSYPQQLFHNRQGRGFEEVAVAAGVAHDEDGRDYAGMGVAVEDYDNDGWPDLFVNALARQSYWLYRNDEGEFRPTSRPSGVGAITDLRSGWGTAFLDYDNDGWRDLFVAQGHVMDDIAQSDPSVSYREPFLLLRNLFGRFFDVSDAAGAAFGVPRAGRGAAFGDLDNDGRIDIAVNNNDGPAVVLRNRGAGDNRWLTVKVVGADSACDAIGARVEVLLESGRRHHAWVSRAGSYLSSGDPRVHFDLGADAKVDRVEVRWPGGGRQVVGDGGVNRIITIEQESER